MIDRYIDPEPEYDEDLWPSEAEKELRHQIVLAEDAFTDLINFLSSPGKLCHEDLLGYINDVCDVLEMKHFTKAPNLFSKADVEACIKGVCYLDEENYAVNQ